MSVVVVDDLEVVEVQHQEDQIGALRRGWIVRRVFILPNHPCHVVSEILGEETAIAQPRQGIGEARLSQASLCLFEFPVLLLELLGAFA